jgi:predicted ATPase/DNA-binding CsgD family transcriptional regulator
VASVLSTDFFSVISHTERSRHRSPPAICEDVTMQVTGQALAAGQARLDAAGVTARETEVLTAIGLRLTNREIAERLVISVRTVESHVSSLLRKLGLPGRPALVQLAKQLPAWPVLPAAMTSFVGRDADLAELSAMLAASTLVCLAGPGGCGKTRLALEAARRWQGEARIADFSAAAPGDVGSAVAAGLGIGYEARDLVVAARVTLRGEVLLVADNCEHVVAAASAVLGTLAKGVPGLRILATSREPLGIDVEHVLPVRPLGLPTGESPADVRACAAGQLFLDRAVAASPRFRLDEASAPHVAAICRRLDGLPLAIELAAARVRNLDVMELAEGIRHRFTLLEQSPRAGRHKSLSSAIEWSWQLLDEEERDLLGRLAVLPGEFTLALAEAVAAGRAGPNARSVLIRLVEQSLVSMRLVNGGARYWLLEVIRAYAQEHATPATREQVAGAHAQFCRDAAEHAVRARYRPTPDGQAPAGFDETNLAAALTWSAEHAPDLADRLLILVSQLAETEPSRQILELIRDTANRCPPRWSSESLAWAGIAVMYLSLDDAQELAHRSTLAATSDRDTALARLITGWVHAYRREESAATALLDFAISYARSAADPWLEASALQARGIARGQPDAAFADWEQALSRFVVSGDLLHANNVRYMLATRAVETHTRLPDVPVWLEGCESFAASHGYKHELAHARRVRAGYELIQGHPDAARQFIDAALPVLRHAGDFRCVARALLDLAQPTVTSDPAAATDILLQCLRAAAIASGPAMQARVLTQLIGTAAAAGDLVLAARCLGALDSLASPAGLSPAGAPGPGDGALDPDLKRALQAPAYATYVSDGHTGGITLIETLYPR